MFELPSIDSSELNCSSELETVGIEDATILLSRRSLPSSKMVFSVKLQPVI